MLDLWNNILVFDFFFRSSEEIFALFISIAFCVDAFKDAVSSKFFCIWNFILKPLKCFFHLILNLHVSEFERDKLLADRYNTAVADKTLREISFEHFLSDIRHVYLNGTRKKPKKLKKIISFLNKLKHWHINIWIFSN